MGNFFKSIGYKMKINKKNIFFFFSKLILNYNFLLIFKKNK
jgi:hypothetical protein